MELHLSPYSGVHYPHSWSGDFETVEILSAAAGDFQRRPPLVTLDLVGTPLDVAIRKPRRVTRSPILCHSVNDARQTGFRLIADSSGRLAFDELLADDAACQRQLARFSTPDNAFFNENTDVRHESDRYFSDRLDNPKVAVSGTTLGLFSAEPSNYGSWLFRVLPKLAIAKHLSLCDFKVACWCPRPFQRDLLKFFGVSDEQIVDVQMTGVYQYEHLLVPTCLNPEAFLNETTLNFVRATLNRQQVVQARRRLIYISRISHARAREYKNVRFFVDEAKLADALVSKGFDIIEPESLTVREQIELFASAAFIVGASGAAMFNTIFCAPGTWVYDIEAFPYWLHAHANYFASCGHNYVIAFGSADMEDNSGPHRRWTIDTGAVARQIEALLQHVL